MMNFDWDEGNISHIARHNVRPEEAEEALLDSRRIGTPAYKVRSEQRWAILGQTQNGRILFVVFTRRYQSIRVVTARDATDKEKKRYRR